MSSTTAHTLVQFDLALKDFRGSVLTMASISQRNLETVFRGLMERNTMICNEAIGEDDDVDDLERRVDREGLELIMRYSPVAGDLREVLGSMRIAMNLERISDQAVNIGRRTRKLNQHSEVAAAKLVEPVYQMASALFGDSIRAYSEGDVALALEVVQKDRKLDKAHNHLIKKLTTFMESDPVNLRSYLHLTFVVRFLERIGDHAVNICEDVVFIQDGADIRHVTEPASMLSDAS